MYLFIFHENLVVVTHRRKGLRNLKKIKRRIDWNIMVEFQQWANLALPLQDVLSNILPGSIPSNNPSKYYLRICKLSLSAGGLLKSYEPLYLVPC